MTAKEYLNRYLMEKAAADALERRIGELRQKKERLSACRYSGMPGRRENGDGSDAVVAIEGLIEKYESVVLAYVAREAHILEELDRMDKDEKTVLLYRYIRNRKPNGEAYTWYEIAEMVPCHKRTAQNLHGRALQHFHVPE